MADSVRGGWQAWQSPSSRWGRLLSTLHSLGSGGPSIPDIALLSLRARLAIALRLFAGYCERRELTHPEVTAYLRYLWRYIGLPDSTQALRQWEADQPPLVDTGLGGEYPHGLREILDDQGVPEGEFRRAVCCTTEVLYCSMYGAADEAGSRGFVSELASLVGPLGVPIPDIETFSGSRWSDGQEWGARLSADELAAWEG